MNKIKQKLRSQSGASITFALLLFLVCAVLCSVIITSATASAGRMSGIAKTDQSYYSVSSACELLKDLLNDNNVAIVTVTTTTYETPIIEGVQGEQEEKSKSVAVYVVSNKTIAELTAMKADEFRSESGIPSSGVQKIDGTGFSGPVSINSFLSDAAYQYYRITKNPLLASKKRSLSLKTNILQPAGVDEDPLAVTIDEEIDKSGNIVFTLYNTGGTPYRQELHFTRKPSVNQKGYPEPPNVQPENPPDPLNYTETKIAMDINILPLMWKLSY